MHDDTLSTKTCLMANLWAKSISNVCNQERRLHSTFVLRVLNLPAMRERIRTIPPQVNCPLDNSPLHIPAGKIVPPPKTIARPRQLPPPKGKSPPPTITPRTIIPGQLTPPGTNAPPR